LIEPRSYFANFEIIGPGIPWIKIMASGLLKEDWRADSPLVREATWDSLLHQTGFSRCYLEIRDFENGDCRLWSFMVSKAVGEEWNRTALPPLGPLDDIDSKSEFQA
jgi:hypothetical protein